MYVAIGGTKGKEQVTVRETTRVPGSTKKVTKIVKNYGYLADLIKDNPNFVEDLKKEIQEERERKKLEKSVTITLPVKPISDTMDQNMCLHFGHMIVNRIWEIMHLDKFFDTHCQAKNKKELLQGVYYLIANGLSTPSSIRSAGMRQNEFGGFKELSNDILYSVLDVLCENKEALIEHLSKYFSKATKRNMDVVSYDVTNYYFESTKEGSLRLFGFSKEHKNNEVLVVMGLLIDSNGIPVAMELFPGNTMDQNTLTDSVLKLEKLYGFKNITVVADRGMNSAENLIFISDNSHHFVISYTLKKSSNEIKSKCLGGRWTYAEHDELTGELIYASKTIDTEVEAKTLMSQEERELIKKERKEKGIRGSTPKYKKVKIPAKIHVTYSKKRALKDKADRDKAIEKAKKRAGSKSQLNRSIRYGANKYLTINLNGQNAELNLSKIKEEEQYDGYYAVITDKLDMPVEEAMEIYKGQWKIEDCFRVLKTDLEARPVFVWTDEHIIGHFVMCYVCLCIIRYLQYMMNDKEKEVMSAARIMNCIKDPVIVAAGDYPKMTLQPTNISEDFIDLIDMLGFKRLENNMTITRFKAITKLNLNDQLKNQN